MISRLLFSRNKFLLNNTFVTEIIRPFSENLKSKSIKPIDNNILPPKEPEPWE